MVQAANILSEIIGDKFPEGKLNYKITPMETNYKNLKLFLWGKDS